MILAGGSGKRLMPLTQAVSKQLLPVYDRPMIYFPLATLMQSGIRDVLVITTPEDKAAFIRLLGDGSQWGISISYAIQPKPEGLAQAFLIGRDFVCDDRACLVLGDNIFHGPGLNNVLAAAAARIDGATIFACDVPDPERFGVVEFDAAGRAISIEEKPARPRSCHAITGLYFYDNRVLDIAADVQPSARGELEIADINRSYLENGGLHVERLAPPCRWFDTGTFDALLDAANFVREREQKSGDKLPMPAEIAWRAGWICDEALKAAAKSHAQNACGDHLFRLLD